MPPFATGIPVQPSGGEERQWKHAYQTPMVFDPAVDSSYDALVIRDMQTGYGAYFKMQEDVGAAAIVSRGPLFPANSNSGGFCQAAGGEGPIPQAQLEGFTNRAWRFKNGSGAGVSGGGIQLTDGKLFGFGNRNTYTVETWVYFEDLVNRGAGNGPYYMDKFPTGERGWRIQVHPTSMAGTLQRGNGVGNDSTNAFSAGYLGIRKWMHLVDTFDGATSRTYLNGKLDSSIAVTGQIDCPENSNLGLRIGSFADIMLCRVALYGNIVLTPAQILEHALAGRPGGTTPQPLPVKWAVPGLAVAIPYVWPTTPPATTVSADLTPSYSAGINVLQSAAPAAQTVVSPSKAFAADVKAGSLLIAILYVRDGTTPQVTDSQGNTWQVAGNPHPGTFADNGRQCALLYAENANAGPTTVTGTSSGGTALIDMMIAEVNGLTGAALLEAISYTFQGSPLTCTSAAVTTARNPAFIVAAAVTRDAISAGSTGTDGYTIMQDGSAFDFNSSKYKVAASPGSQSAATWTNTGTVGTWMVAASFATSALATVGANLSPAYQTAAPVGANLSPVYAAAVTAGADLAPAYQTRALAAATLAPAYVTTALATATLAPAYVTTILATASLSPSYVGRALATADLAPAYVTTALATATLAPAYVGRALATADLSPAYVTRIVSAAADLSPSYIGKALAGANLAPSYATAGVVSADLAPTYVTRVVAGLDLAPSYVGRALAGLDLAPSYVTRIVSAPANLAPAYVTRALAGLDLAPSYVTRIVGPFADLAPSYSGRIISAPANLAPVYATTILAGASLSPVYVGRALATANLAPAYTTAARVGLDLSPSYSTVAAGVVGVQLAPIYTTFVLATSSLAPSYVTRVLSVPGNLPPVYVTRELAGLNLAPSYVTRIVAPFVDLAPVYVTRILSAPGNLAPVYVTRVAAFVELQPTYAARTFASSLLAPTYVCFQLAQAQLQTVYVVVQLVGGSLVAVYAVLLSADAAVAPVTRWTTVGGDDRRDMVLSSNGLTDARSGRIRPPVVPDGTTRVRSRGGRTDVD